MEPVCVFQSDREMEALAVRDLLIQEGLNAVLLLRQFQSSWRKYLPEPGEAGLGNGISLPKAAVYVPPEQVASALDQISGFFDPRAVVLQED